MLWVTIIGYAAISKTLTNIINDNTQDDILDNYLSSIYNSIESRKSL